MVGMRKSQKAEVLDFIKSMYQAHEEIEKALKQGKGAAAQNMLSECQEFAIALGEAIEKTEGEGHVTVSHIEAYCEMAFRIFEDIGNSAIDVNKVHKMLKKSLLRIENSVKADIRVKKEIVFLPYKAAMWDSLESLYLASREDEDSNVYCVPIPYYDLKPDRSFGEMHYEGKDYPSDIEIVGWQDYRLEERKPDEIYIHNPYDECNLVTSVHPKFYSSNLKRYTEKLIYVPYFVLGEIDPKDTETVEKIRHFCFLPGTVNADLVIVESENIKNIYVSEYLKAARAAGLSGNHVDREHLERKILGLGSPKYDKVLKTKKEDLDIPDEWMKHIVKPDGTRKKVVFYNTGIAALLRYNEEWIDKIEHSLALFEANSDKVALLWRPHPLIENTMKAMRPEVLERYLSIKERYMKAGWGIFDNTANLDRAVSVSDAYYGDNSSVVQLYVRVNKPVMLASYGG